MKFKLPPGRSLEFYGLLSWLVPGVLAGMSCVLMLAGSAALEHRGELRRVAEELADKSNVVARRISAEMLIGQRGAVQSVSDLLKSELSLSKIELTTAQPKCELASDVCTEKNGSALTVYRRVPAVSETYFVAVSKTLPGFLSFVRVSGVLWSTLPIALVLGFGIIFQRVILRRYILNPVESLVDTSTGDTEPKDHWPSEIKNISERLYRSFEVRDKEIFSQIARGVIHDLRTLIHTPLTAVELASEADADKRTQRLEHLHSVCAQQLTKMKEIIDNTLDGSREIPVNKAPEKLGAIVDGASRTLETLLAQTKTSLSVANSLEDRRVLVDRVQVERAVTNLIKNGIEACQEQGEAKRTVSVDIAAHGQDISICVEDSGPGLAVPAGKLIRPLKSTKLHGSGLGLVVTRKIVETHGGRLVIGRSERLGGAKFKIELPKALEGGLA